MRDILAQPWLPEDNIHTEKIYFVAGALIKMIDNLAKRSKDIYTNALHDIKTNSATTKLDQRNGFLPLGKVEAKESYCLCYANQRFYDFVSKIGSVFDTLLSEGNVAYSIVPIS